MSEYQNLVCSFCGKRSIEIRHMFANEGYMVAICDECVRRAVEAASLKNKELREQQETVK